MSKNVQTRRGSSNLQHVSKILYAQLVADATNCPITEEEEKNGYVDKVDLLLDSGYLSSKRLSSFEHTGKFTFSFEWKRLGVIVTYMNSDGMVSAAFRNAQWKTFIRFTADRVHKIREHQREERFKAKVRKVMQ
jgi:hypothetical protein